MWVLVSKKGEEAFLGKVLANGIGTPRGQESIKCIQKSPGVVWAGGSDPHKGVLSGRENLKVDEAQFQEAISRSERLYSVG